MTGARLSSSCRYILAKEISCQPVPSNITALILPAVLESSKMLGKYLFLPSIRDLKQHSGILELADS